MEKTAVRRRRGEGVAVCSPPESVPRAPTVGPGTGLGCKEL